MGHPEPYNVPAAIGTMDTDVRPMETDSCEWGEAAAAVLIGRNPWHAAGSSFRIQAGQIGVCIDQNSLGA